MTQNLRYMGDTVGSSSTATRWYLKSDTSNIRADKTMYMTDLTSGNSYDDAEFHNSSSTTIGVWYNYAAASAMTITGSSNTGTQTYDICPKNWRLPTNSEQSGITSYVSAYSPVASGNYYNGSLTNTGYGYWWSSTSASASNRYILYFDGNGSSIVLLIVIGLAGSIFAVSITSTNLPILLVLSKPRKSILHFTTSIIPKSPSFSISHPAIAKILTETEGWAVDFLRQI